MRLACSRPRRGARPPWRAATVRAIKPAPKAAEPAPLPPPWPPSDPADPEESADVAKEDLRTLFVASIIGLTTGCGVVVFNDLVHAVQDELVWRDIPKLAAFGTSALQVFDPRYALWRCLLLPPVVAGVVVAALRHVAGGFDGDPASVAVRIARSGRARRRAAVAEAVRMDGSLAERACRDEFVATGACGAVAEARRAARPYLKTVAAAMTLGAGASLGPEGPSAELGRANAANVQRVLPVRVRTCGHLHCHDGKRGCGESLKATTRQRPFKHHPEGVVDAYRAHAWPPICLPRAPAPASPRALAPRCPASSLPSRRCC